MDIQRLSIEASPSTLCWVSEWLVDWASAAAAYSLDGQRLQLASFHWRYRFDRAITSADGRYAFIYYNLGTEGLLLKEGELLREISRSDYHAGVYEYPAAFVTVADVTYLVHCPISYNQLDFEEVETGQLVTNITSRQPNDFFHSRLEVSPAGTILLSKG
jgi:hypothetical protein